MISRRRIAVAAGLVAAVATVGASHAFAGGQHTNRPCAAMPPTAAVPKQPVRCFDTVQQMLA